MSFVDELVNLNTRSPVRHLGLELLDGSGIAKVPFTVPFELDIILPPNEPVVSLPFDGLTSIGVT